MNRRTFLICGALSPVILQVGCTEAEVEADIQTVLNDLPTAIQIAESIITIISAFKGTPVSASTVAQVKNIAGQMSSDLTLAQGIITQYQTDLAGAPQPVLVELDDAVSDIQTNETAILNAVHVYDTTTQAAVAASVAAVDTVLLGLESILPPSAAAKFPKVASVLIARGKTLGAMPKVGIPKRHDLAANYNAKVKADFPTAVVPVPRAHWYSL